MLENIFSFLKGILLKGQARFGNILCETVVGWREKFKALAEDFGRLAKFAAVAGGENYFSGFHECKYPKNTGKIRRNG